MINCQRRQGQAPARCEKGNQNSKGFQRFAPRSASSFSRKRSFFTRLAAAAKSPLSSSDGQLGLQRAGVGAHFADQGFQRVGVLLAARRPSWLRAIPFAASKLGRIAVLVVFGGVHAGQRQQIARAPAAGAGFDALHWRGWPIAAPGCSASGLAAKRSGCTSP